MALHTMVQLGLFVESEGPRCVPSLKTDSILASAEVCLPEAREGERTGKTVLGVGYVWQLIAGWRVNMSSPTARIPFIGQVLLVPSCFVCVDDCCGQRDAISQMNTPTNCDHIHSFEEFGSSFVPLPTGTLKSTLVILRDNVYRLPIPGLTGPA